MFSRLKLERQALILIGMLLFFQLLFVGIVGGIVYMMHQEVERDFRSRQISLGAFRLVRQSTETAMKLNLEPGFGAKPADERVRRQAAIDNLTASTNALVEECQPFHEMDGPINELKSSTKALLSIFGWMSYHQQFGTEHWERLNSQLDTRLFALSEQTLKSLQNIRELEEARQQQFVATVKRLRRYAVLALGYGVPLSIVIAAAFAAFYASGVRRPLEHVRKNCLLMAERKELLPPLSGSNEISELDRAMHEIAFDVKEALARDELLIDNARDVICSITRDGTIMTASKSMERIFKLQPEQARNEKVFALLPPEKRADFRAFLDNCCASAQSKTMDLPVLRGDGSLVKTSWTSFWSEEHKTIFSVVHDVSQLKEAERQQREFLELVTIDLRAPLIAASESFAAIVNNKDECKDVLSEIESARSNLERLLAFADDLVDFQRLQIGEMTMHKAEADLCSLVRQSIELLQPLAVEKNLTVSFLPAGEALVRCDELKITKVLTNLLSNAITWSPAGGEIEIALNKASTSLEVSVRDEGPGIPLEFRNSVFEAFEQIPGSSKKQGGTGLGLAICRKIVEAHGGTIGVRKPDEVRFAPQGQGKAGSVFWFTVPLTVTGSPRED